MRKVRRSGLVKARRVGESKKCFSENPFSIGQLVYRDNYWGLTNFKSNSSDLMEVINVDEHFVYCSYPFKKDIFILSWIYLSPHSSTPFDLRDTFEKFYDEQFQCG